MKTIAAPVFWRVEGSLLNLSAVRPVAFFTWNAQSFTERWARRGGLGLLALVRPFLYATDRVFATRVLHALLRGVSRDRLDLLGEEYFQYVLKPRLKQRGVEKLREVLAAGPAGGGANGPVVLVSQGLDHVMRPLANHLGVERLLANRLEFRDGLATGRLLDPVVRPRGVLARLIGRNPDGRLSGERLAHNLGFSGRPEILISSSLSARRRRPQRARPPVLFEPEKNVRSLSVRDSLEGKNILLIGVTGFIAKVWLTNLLSDLPSIGKIYLLIRPQRTKSARQRFEKIVEESPVFDGLHERHGQNFARYVSDRVEVVEGDVTRPGLGLDPATKEKLLQSLDLIVNSSGLTEFNPDIRQALATNVDATATLLDFLRQTDHAGLLHLSTCYVVGARDGRVSEDLRPNYTPAHVPDFDAEKEWRALHDLNKDAEARSHSAEVTEELRRQALAKNTAAKNLSGTALENQIRKNRIRWLRTHLTEEGIRRARELGWPNTYTYTKSLAESLIQKLAPDLPVAVVRPSIVETSVAQPFPGWNEGVNTSGPLSHLLGTYFRQLPTNERKCLDLIPVDVVCRGLTLIAAALIARRHQRLYQLATSANNPCDMRRSIELTSLAHRKHYRAQEGLEHWLRSRFDTIPVSKTRYQRLSAPRQRAIVRGLKRIIAPLPFIRARLARRERDLDKVEKLIQLYEPFILHHEHVFESEHVLLLSRALPPQEAEAFSYDSDSVDWWDYWINVHVPALRKWCYPLIEGRRLASGPRRRFQLPEPAVSSAVESPAGDSNRQALTPEATWPSS